jgi:hypothetical protein
MRHADRNHPPKRAFFSLNPQARPGDLLCAALFCRLPLKSRPCKGVGMSTAKLAALSTADLIYEKARRLPDELQLEALHYVDGLLARQAETKERPGWPRFSAQQLARQFSPADAIYDQE